MTNSQLKTHNSRLRTQNLKLNFLETLSKFSDQKIAVIGDLILDKYIYGKVERISPEAPVPIVTVQRETFVPGGAANVAANVASLSGRAFLLGIVGPDQFKDELIGKLEESKIDCRGVLIDSSKHTTLKTRVIGLNQQLLRIDREDTHYIESHFESEFLTRLKEIENLSAIILSDYAKGTITKELVVELKKFCSEKSIPLLVDPKPKHKDWYNNSFLVTPNKKEAQEMSGITIESEEDFLTVGKKLVNDLSANLIITAGSEGMYIFEKGKRDKVKGVREKEAFSDSTPNSTLTTQNLSFSHISTQAKEIYDVSGAGDTVVATLALAISSGASISQAAQLANSAAGIKVGKMGTAPIFLEELVKEIQKKD
ncbi:MAG: PfkB family carbohydrate kinase [Candidatus Cloacimonadales bacterium]|nr:PfkB family carbohydrate kinase [Candidatus Cloacimonadales bacterium]